MIVGIGNGIVGEIVVATADVVCGVVMIAAGTDVADADVDADVDGNVANTNTDVVVVALVEVIAVDAAPTATAIEICLTKCICGCRR